MGTSRVNRYSHLVWVVIAGAVFVGDQVTKAAVEDLIPEHTTVPLLPHFGLFSDSPTPWKTILLIVVSSLLLAVVFAMMWRNPQLRWETGLGLALILGGAFSNLFDRIRLGRVVDFIDVYWRSYHWPTFNLADSAIVVGAGFLVFQLLFLE
jgi:signal peptidase II